MQVELRTSAGCKCGGYSCDQCRGYLVVELRLFRGTRPHTSQHFCTVRSEEFWCPLCGTVKSDHYIKRAHPEMWQAFNGEIEKIAITAADVRGELKKQTRIHLHLQNALHAADEA